MTRSLVAFLIAWPALAEEPGYLRNAKPLVPREAPPKAVQQLQTMEREFAAGRGLNDYEVRTLGFQRVSCDRRLFSPDGFQIQGDGDLKVTDMGSDNIMAEFPSHFSFVAYDGFNPYRHGISDVDTVSALQFIKVRPWRNGQPLTIKKWVSVTFADEKRAPQRALAVGEFRVMGGTYPLTFVVRETIFSDPPFTVYYLCR